MLAVSVAVAAGAFGVSALCVAGLRRWATERMLDIPIARSSHTKPTPRGGGVGIVIGVLFGGWGLFLTRILGISFEEIMALSLGGGIVASAGWIDDIYRLPYQARLAVQALASAIVIIAVGPFSAMAVPFVGEIQLNSLSIPFVLLWMIGLTNAYNFMDGIDGIAGGQAVVAGLSWMVIGFLSGQSSMGLIGLLLAASSLGFLFHNWPPARIFMGDVGSGFLGFTFAVLPLYASRFHTDLIAERMPVAGFLIVSPFVIDATFTFARRLFRRERLSQAHRSHLYQRLVISGLSHRTVTFLYSLLGLIGGAAGVSFIFLQARSLANIVASLATVAILTVPLFWALSREAEGSPKI